MNNREKKIQILKRLVEDKIVTFEEALLLLEPEKEYVYQWYPGIQYVPYTPPYSPIYVGDIQVGQGGTGNWQPQLPFTTCEGKWAGATFGNHLNKDNEYEKL